MESSPESRWQSFPVIWLVPAADGVPKLLTSHISDSGRIPLKEQAGIVLKTSHNAVLSLAETLPGNAADLCGQGILFGFAQGNGGFRIDKWHGNILLYI